MGANSYKKLSLPAIVRILHANVPIRRVRLPYEEPFHQNITTILHTLDCSNTVCEFRGCAKMKRILEHTKMCHERCPTCKKLVNLCVYHASVCRNDMCPMYDCRNFKEKIRFATRNATHARSLVELKAVHQFPIPTTPRLWWLKPPSVE
jgi:hypothetical protein